MRSWKLKKFYKIKYFGFVKPNTKPIKIYFFCNKYQAKKSNKSSATVLPNYKTNMQKIFHNFI